MKRGMKRWIVVTAIVAAGAALTLVLWPRGTGKPPQAASASQPTDDRAQPSGVTSAPAARGAVSATLPAQPTAATQPTTAEVITDAQAAADVEKGLALLKDNKILPARAVLSKAYLSGKLPPAQASELRKTLLDLADQTLLKNRGILDNDPFAFYYTFKSGEVLQRVEAQQELRVPPELILKVNGIASAGTIRAGQVLKMIRGPFHAIVDKSDFRMDIYLRSPSGETALVRSFTVGLGKDGCTPAGRWRATKRLWHPQYNPTANSANRQAGASIAYGEPGYSFGVKGLWVGLMPVDEHNQGLMSYGIHSTNYPDSIGKAESEGCIRVGDEDIEWVYNMLYASWSQVDIVE